MYKNKTSEKPKFYANSYNIKIMINVLSKIKTT